MRFPRLSTRPTTQEMVEVFGGYNHNLRIGDGEFYHMTNLTSTDYPVLSPRARRGFYAAPEAAHGLIGKDVLCYVDGSTFVMGDERIEMGLTNDKKTLISMGAYVIIMPDKKYINTANTDDRGDIEATVVTTSAVTFELCKLDGERYENVAVQDTEPTSPVNMTLWLDTSGTPHTLKQFSSTTSMWVTIATTYIKISAPGIGAPFAAGDGVTISDVEDAALADLNNTMIVYDRGDDFIIVTGLLDKVTTQETPMTVTRRMPNMDFIIESENRLWGCRYGEDVSGNIVNEIYACKLGDFKNWNCFMGISTDSYAATVGTDGAFTGAVAHLGYPIFFKESCMHKVYGNFPSNYQIQTTACRGVQRGCAGSLAIVNEILYYKARTAVCAYDGSLPVEMSAPLGDVSYDSASAGALGNKYYISMRDTGGSWHLFVYDTLRGMWHREDDTQVVQFCPYGGDLYFIRAKDGQIWNVLGQSCSALERDIHWSCETGEIGLSSPQKKYISRLDVRMLLDIDATVDFYIQYDSCGEWEHLFTMIGSSLESFSVPIRPRRCDHLRLRADGVGDAKIFSLCKTIERGSERS